MPSYFVSHLEIPLLGFGVYSIKYICHRYVINNFVEIDIYNHCPGCALYNFQNFSLLKREPARPAVAVVPIQSGD
jgi:hypothetical protein